MAEPEDVALVRRGYEAFSTGDGATLTEVIAVDATQYQPRSGELAGEHNRREASLNFCGRLGSETNGSFRVELEHLYTDGQGRVCRDHHATCQRQGRKLDTRASLTFTVSDGMARDTYGCLGDIDAWDTFWA